VLLLTLHNSCRLLSTAAAATAVLSVGTASSSSLLVNASTNKYDFYQLLSLLLHNMCIRYGAAGATGCLMCATFSRADLQRLTRLLGLSVYCHDVTPSGRSGGRRLTNKELAVVLCNKDKHPSDSPAPRKPWVGGNTLGGTYLKIGLKVKRFLSIGMSFTCGRTAQNKHTHSLNSVPLLPLPLCGACRN
jgi:hypothetical protein